MLDASAALALSLVEEEGARVADVLENTISRNGQIFVPGVFWYDVGNGLFAAEKQNRLSREQLADATSFRAVHELALRSQTSLTTCDAHLTALRGAYPRPLTP